MRMFFNLHTNLHFLVYEVLYWKQAGKDVQMEDVMTMLKKQDYSHWASEKSEKYNHFIWGI